MMPDLSFVCPLCRGSLDLLPDSYACGRCERTYPLHDGIPDFRVFADPYLDFEADRQRTEVVLAALEGNTLERLLEHYWSMSDVTPLDLRKMFVRSAMLGEPRARRVEHLLRDSTFRQPITARRVIEIGSGTGNFLVEAVGRYEQIVGTDIAMRWLHVSRRRFMDRGLPIPPLVCCCAEHLPFPDSTFDLAVCSATLEFTQNQDQTLAESARVLSEGGSMYVSTVNRFSIALNPYVYLWGVGFLPRRWQSGYVRWRRDASFENIHLLSLGELRQMARKHFSEIEIALSDIDNESLRKLPSFTRFQIGAYRMFKRFPMFDQILKWCGPQWDAKFTKNQTRQDLP